MDELLRLKEEEEKLSEQIKNNIVLKVQEKDSEKINEYDQKIKDLKQKILECRVNIELAKTANLERGKTRW